MELLPQVTRTDVEVASPEAKAESIAAGFLTNYGNAHTQRAYRRDLRGWARFCESHGIDVVDATRPVLNLYARALEAAGRAPATVARQLGTIAGFYAYAVAEGHLPASPAAHLRRPRVSDDSQTLGLDRHEMRSFFAAAVAAPSTLELPLVCLLGLNGLRVSEACEADAAGMGTEHGHQVLAIVRKGGSAARVPLVDFTVAAIAAHLAGRQLGPLLLDARGRRLTSSQAATVVRRLARTAGLDKRISPHSLRHAFVTISLDQGTKLRDVQSAAGHKDPKTTMRYDRARHSLDRHPTHGLVRFLLADGAA